MKKNFAKLLTLCLAFMLMLAIPASAKTYPLTDFRITGYYDSSKNIYTQNGGTISKSKGPLVIDTVMYGNGRIYNDGVYLDGAPLSPSSNFSIKSEVLQMDPDYNITKWKYTITLKPEHGTDYTKQLSNGSHTLKIVCFGARNPIISTITFNVVD